MTHRWTQPGLLALCVVLIGGLDYLSGPDIGFSLFYLVPIVWGAWHRERWVGLSLALLAYCFWMGAEAVWHGITPISVWNGFTRLGIYVAMAWLASRVRSDEMQLRALNDRLRELLEHEQHLARTDSLTGLPNRRLFLDELKRATARIHRTRKPIAVGYLDLDGFKTFNDRMGHAAGDVVLRRVAETLAAQVRGTDIAARLGGAQFAVLLDQCTEENARITATRLVDQLVTGISEVASRDVGVSLGVACFEDESFTAEAMVDHADAAMYCAKGQGANSVYVTRLAPAISPVQPA
jgi:diguanylate cyclase (GGDEF)-like protein